MPELITKKEALRLLSFGNDPKDCLICRINTSGKYILAEDKHCVILLSEYPRFWGHVIVSLKKHKEKHSELSEKENTALFKHAHKAAKVIEKLLNPSRCYIAALGSEQNHINTCPHIHINVIPVYDKNLKPSAVFTWEKGLWSGSKKEWKKLYDSIKSGLITL